jgi:hypothetical protein
LSGKQQNTGGKKEAKVKMNFRARILGKIRGENDFCPLFVPRLDIWHSANRMRNSIPREFKDLSLMQIAQKLEVGFHSVIPPFMSTGNVEDIYHRGLGFYNHPSFPYKVDFSDTDFEAEIRNGELKVTYFSKSGPITTGINYSPEFLHSGASIPDVTEFAIKEHDDYFRLADIFSRIKIVPAPENYAAHHDLIGDNGLAVAFLSLAAGPMQHIMRDLVRFDQFIYDVYDFPLMMRELAAPLTEIYKKIIDSARLTEAEVVLFGANYDAAITCPPFFDEHIKPWLEYAGVQLHASGKFLLTHTDGENKGLIQSYLDSKFDIADSICPAPMTSMSMQEYRAAFKDKISIWGGIPSVIMLSSSCSDGNFKDFIDRLIEESYPFNNLIFSIADTMPPDTDFDRLLYICEKMGLHQNLLVNVRNTELQSKG